MNTIAVLAGIIATPFLPLLLPHGTIGLSHPPQASPEEYRQFKFLQDSLEQYKAGTESRFCLDDELCVNFYKGPASVAWITVRGWPMTSESLALTAVMIYVLVMICRLLRRFDSDTQKTEPVRQEKKSVAPMRRGRAVAPRDFEVVEAAKVIEPTLPASNNTSSGGDSEPGAWTTLKWPRRELVDDLMSTGGYHDKLDRFPSGAPTRDHDSKRDAGEPETMEQIRRRLEDIRQSVKEDTRQMDEIMEKPITWGNTGIPLSKLRQEQRQEVSDVTIGEPAEREWDMV